MRVIAIAFILALAAIVAPAARGAGRDPPLAIHSAFADGALTRITIRGVSFPTPTPPVRLRGMRTALALVSGDDRTIVASLPAGIEPGTYFVILGAAEPLATIPVAFGSVGGQGPAGPAGVAGVPGAMGSPGDGGAVGPTGATGPQGPAGVMGPTGFDGPVGPVGEEGPPAHEVQFGRGIHANWDAGSFCGASGVTWGGMAPAEFIVAAPATVYLWGNLTLATGDADPSLVLTVEILAFNRRTGATIVTGPAMSLGPNDLGALQVATSLHTNGGNLRFDLGASARNPPCIPYRWAGAELQWMVVYD